jgi:hypothetical protein
MENIIIYPIYRKLSNNRSFYKIIGESQFDEIQLIGTKIKLYTHKAIKYPEILFIQDLIHFTNEGIKESNNEEWMMIANI